MRVLSGSVAFGVGRPLGSSATASSVCRSLARSAAPSFAATAACSVRSATASAAPSTASAAVSAALPAVRAVLPAALRARAVVPCAMEATFSAASSSASSSASYGAARRVPCRRVLDAVLELVEGRAAQPGDEPLAALGEGVVPVPGAVEAGQRVADGVHGQGCRLGRAAGGRRFEHGRDEADRGGDGRRDGAGHGAVLQGSDGVGCGQHGCSAAPCLPGAACRTRGEREITGRAGACRT